MSPIGLLLLWLGMVAMLGVGLVAVRPDGRLMAWIVGAAVVSGCAVEPPTVDRWKPTHAGVAFDCRQPYSRGVEGDLIHKRVTREFCSW